MENSPDILLNEANIQGTIDFVPQLHASSQVTVPKSSWLVRFFGFLRATWMGLLGLISLIVLLAIVSSVPILNLLGFGYLLEVSKRMAERRTIKEIFVGIDKARLIGGALIGSWLMLVPIRVLSHIAEEANLIDPGGQVSARLDLARLIAVVFIVAHVAAALMCGGKLRYFFWPLLAPISIAVWLMRRIANWHLFHSTIRWTTQWWCPGLADDIGRVRPIVDWFLPAIFLQRMRQPRLLSGMVQQTWQFVVGLRLPHYFRLGLLGFVGTFLWLILPTLLLAGATLNRDSSVSTLYGVLGVLLAIPIFSLLPILQTQFATTGHFRSFLEIRGALNIFRKAPIWHLISWIVVVALAFPLYLLKIETVPRELLWLLSIVFLVFTLPSRVAMGWAHSRSLKRASPRTSWLTMPIGGLVLTVSAFCVLVLTTTRYLSWNGAFSLFENHLFLLPTPFWL